MTSKDSQPDLSEPSTETGQDQEAEVGQSISDDRFTPRSGRHMAGLSQRDALRSRIVIACWPPELDRFHDGRLAGRLARLPRKPVQRRLTLPASGLLAMAPVAVRESRWRLIDTNPVDALAVA